MILFKQGSPTDSLSSSDMQRALHGVLDTLKSQNMLIVPPDITRLPSRAGELTRYAYQHNPSAVKAILPALGTHCPMTDQEIETMFGNLPKKLFTAHNWRTDCVKAGEVPGSFVEEVSEGQLSYSVPVAINKLAAQGGHDCILSIGQIVPHEVAGMAGHAKNIFVGLGGAENIHKSHFLGAVYGIERIMGKAQSPVRKVFNYAMDNYFGNLPIVHVLTVLGKDDKGLTHVRGLFIGTGKECFELAADLSCKVNMHFLNKPLSKVVVYLDPIEYKSFWLGNKSIYRTRMAIADEGELIVLAPGIKMCGEDPEIDRLIRQFGYKGTPATMNHVAHDEAMKNNLSAAAHLIHGSSEGRFSITYCTGGLSKAEVEQVGFSYGSVEQMLKKYDPAMLPEGPNKLPSGEEFYFISNPATGLWADKTRFERQSV